ncbi:gp125 [Mycobacterium phage Omega]|uniref:Uncharacterized protein n=1 Tax=Mycobacterium phage Omega TaxID=2907835 RepID=Q854E3_BPMOM|nr:gp125 [Mycobacterium phage Omega]AAN12765.1 hypothetical protein PBI_OMEGA_125 [Mycobacterium phage Omega]
MTAPIFSPVELSLSEFEFTVPCGIEGCDHDADWMSWGDHSAFGCPGYGPVCEWHRRLTLRYVEGIEGQVGPCSRCKQPRVIGPDEFRFIEL